MKTIMIIDGADNTAYDCFAADEHLFEIIFPEPDQDIEFFEDLRDRVDVDELEEDFNSMWARPLDRRKISGIDGILFYELERRKEHYPNKRDTDLDGWARSWSLAKMRTQT